MRTPRTLRYSLAGVGPMPRPGPDGQGKQSPGPSRGPRRAGTVLQTIEQQPPAQSPGLIAPRTPSQRLSLYATHFVNILQLDSMRT